MATKVWRGDAQVRRQVTTLTVAGVWATGDTATVTINGKDLVLTVGTAATTADVASALAAMLASADAVGDETRSALASSVPELTGVEAEADASVVSLTGPDTGAPFTVTATEVTVGTGTVSAATPTAPTGPNHYDDPENWEPVNVPVTADDIVFERSDVDVLYGIDQSAVTPNTVRALPTFTGRIGLPPVNAEGRYREYRPQYLTFNGVTAGAFVEDGDGAGSGRIKLDFGTATAATVTVAKTGQGEEDGVPAVLLAGGNAGNVLNLTGGSVGLAFDTGTTGEWPVVNVSQAEGSGATTRLVCGQGSTLGTVRHYGGDVTVQSDVTTYEMTAGTLRWLAGAVTTLTVDGGTVFWQSAGTLTTGVFRNKGTTLDAERDPRTRTATNLSVTKGAALFDGNKRITFTTPVAIDRDSLAVSDLGSAFNLQRS